MAFRVEIDFVDANGDEASTSFYVGQSGDAATAIQIIDAHTNALIKSARLITPIPLQTITNNDAVAASNESVRTKAKVKMRGADLGSLADPYDYVTVSIPAPIGTLINGQSGDVNNAEIQALVGKCLSDSGVTMDTVTSIKYAKSR